MWSRSDAVKILNDVANRPEVLIGIAPAYQGVDLASFFRNPRNVMLGDERGVVIFVHLCGNEFEGHYLLTDAFPSIDKMQFFRAALHELFTTHGASVIRGNTPRKNRAARAVNRALGFCPVGETIDSQGRACISYALERESWATSLGA